MFDYLIQAQSLSDDGWGVAQSANIRYDGKLFEFDWDSSYSTDL